MTTVITDDRAHDVRRAAPAVPVHLPGDAGYETGRVPWNVAVEQWPAAVAEPADAREVAAVIRASGRAGLRVATQGTGHNAGPLGDLSDTVLLRTHRMTGARMTGETMRVGAGTLWSEAVSAAAHAGRSVLHGSSPDVGVVGYSLGGGMGWYARKHGLQTNAITAAEVVLADGSCVRADADTEPDLFWALRGGGGNLGIVTALEFRTLPFATAYGGMLVWDAEHAERVLSRWVEWADAPDEVTTSCRLLQLPPLPALPDALRGRRLVAVDGAVLAEDAAAERVLAPLRELGPEIDTFARVPASSLVRLHMDPEGPTPSVSASSLLADLPPAAVGAFLDATTDSSLLAAELRQLGGALGRPAPGAGAMSSVAGRFLLFGVAVAPDAESARRGERDAGELVHALDRWSAQSLYLNFTESRVNPSDAYSAAALERLRAVRRAVDPHGVIRANHPVG